jgi:hypothetical protein
MLHVPFPVVRKTAWRLYLRKRKHLGVITMNPDEFGRSALFRIMRCPRSDGSVGRAGDDGLILVAEQDVIDPVCVGLD